MTVKKPVPCSVYDPQAPKLYTDHQSLAVALDGLMKRDVRNAILVALFTFFMFVLFVTRGQFIRELLLWESPRALVSTITFLILVFVMLPLLVVKTRKTLNIRRTPAQGLPLFLEALDQKEANL